MSQKLNVEYFVAILVLSVSATTTQADVNINITHGSTTINMDFVTVGNPGNAADTEMMIDGTTGYGAVDYSYNIGKYEVTANQWDAVSGASATDLLDDPGYWSGNQPVARISWSQAAMFCNWLTSGDVTDGAYTINSTGLVTGIDRRNAVSTHGTVYVIPNEDEWYKAAYYNGDSNAYYNYSTGSDNVPDGIDFNGDTTFDAVFYDLHSQQQPNAVDNAGVLSPYGTMGQGGNVLEWNETFIVWNETFCVWEPGLRGGGWFTSSHDLAASCRRSYDPVGEAYYIGFRVASVPEPGSIALLLCGLTGLICLRCRK